MSDPVRQLKQELLVAAERQHGQTLLAPESRRRWLERFVPGGVAGLSWCWPRSRSPRS